MSTLPKRYFTPEEYLLLEERSPYKSQYINGEITVQAQPGDRLVFVSLESELTLAEMYDKVDLPVSRGLTPR